MEQVGEQSAVLRWRGSAAPGRGAKDKNPEDLWEYLVEVKEKRAGTTSIWPRSSLAVVGFSEARFDMLGLSPGSACEALVTRRSSFVIFLHLKSMGCNWNERQGLEI